ncbi:MFS transporter [Nocardioides sp. BGMRC 2183]|nr:MFS transporter [Nocardioides sp. BGMRC 2183]
MRSPKTGGGSGQRWLAALWANTVLIQGITFVLRPTAIYRAIELDVPAPLLGALGASFALVPLVLAIPSGQAADRFGERSVMIAGSIATLTAALGFLAIGDSVGGLLLGCVLLGTGHLGSVVAQQALVANRTPRNSYDRAFGRYTFAASAGQAVGPALILLFGGGNAIPHTSTIFAWTSGLSVLLLATALALPRTSSPPPSTGAGTGGMATLLRRPGLALALGISCVVLAAVDITLVYLPLLGTELGIASGMVGLLLSLRAAASMISRFYLGRLSARLGRGRLLTTSIVLSAAAMTVLPLGGPLPLLGVLIVLLGLGLGVGQPLTMSWLAEATPPGLRGRAMSLRLTGNRLGQVVVPSLAGAVAAGAGAGGVLWFTAAALAVAAAGSRRIPS